MRQKLKQKRKRITKIKVQNKAETAKIVKLMKESQTHDHRKCNCEGCYWWAMTKTITKTGRFYEVVPSWKDLPLDEYLRNSRAYLKYKEDKTGDKEKITKYLIKHGAPKKEAEKMAESMCNPSHVIMIGRALSPLGLLRDI